MKHIKVNDHVCITCQISTYIKIQLQYFGKVIEINDNTIKLNIGYEDIIIHTNIINQIEVITNEQNNIIHSYRSI